MVKTWNRDRQDDIRLFTRENSLSTFTLNLFLGGITDHPKVFAVSGWPPEIFSINSMARKLTKLWFLLKRDEGITLQRTRGVIFTSKQRSGRSERCKISTTLEMNRQLAKRLGFARCKYVLIWVSIYIYNYIYIYICTYIPIYLLYGFSFDLEMLRHDWHTCDKSEAFSFEQAHCSQSPLSMGASQNEGTSKSHGNGEFQ